MSGCSVLWKDVGVTDPNRNNSDKDVTFSQPRYGSYQKHKSNKKYESVLKLVKNHNFFYVKGNNQKQVLLHQLFTIFFNF